MNNNKVYGIFSGAYSDWSVHGYMTDLDEAEKYCALKNQNNTYDWENYYVVEINSIKADVSKVKLKYYHRVMFQFGIGMVKSSDGYDYYIGEDREPVSRYNVFNNNNGWITFSFNCETREKAEKIAQDKYAEFLTYYSENKSYEASAELIGSKHI